MPQIAKDEIVLTFFSEDAPAFSVRVASSNAARTAESLTCRLQEIVRDDVTVCYQIERAVRFAHQAA